MHRPIHIDDYIHGIMKDPEKQLYLKVSGIITFYGSFVGVDGTEDPYGLENVYFLYRPDRSRDDALTWYIQTNEQLNQLLLFSGQHSARQWLEDQLEQVGL